MAVDLFTPVVPDARLHPSFKALATETSFEPAKRMLQLVAATYDDKDGNFVEQFQTTAFDGRLWELYLHAFLHEAGFVSSGSCEAPDYVVSKDGEAVCIEAITVNPTQGKQAVPSPEEAEEPKDLKTILYEIEHVYPIKFGSPLFSKLKKRYWTLDHVRGRPFVLAIEDFHAPASMVHTHPSITFYLFGFRFGWTHGEQGTLEILPEHIGHHQVPGKNPVPSGFFDQPDTEHVSAVLFSNSGTISKFNRMGFQQGFRPKDLVMMRVGLCYDPTPNSTTPCEFDYQVGDPEWKETWGQGTSIFYNPKARVPLKRELFKGVAHHFRQADGNVQSFLPDFMPYCSRTFMIRPTERRNSH